MDDDEFLSRHHPVEEDMRMQQRVWRFERVGWYALVLIVILATAGLFGNGPLSNALATSSDGRLQVEYQRLSRSGSVDKLRITVRGISGQPVMVMLGGSLVQEASIETLQPEPQASFSQGDSLLLQVGTRQDGIATLYLTLRSDYVGKLDGIVKAGLSSTVHFYTFLYP